MLCVGDEVTILDLILARVERKEPAGIPAFYHLINIAKAARDVRAAQATYFKSRDRSDLIESKRAEKILDDLLNEQAGRTT